MLEVLPVDIYASLGTFNNVCRYCLYLFSGDSPDSVGNALFQLV